MKRSNKYRVVRDNFAGYEAQIKFWWLPFMWWEMRDGHRLCNTHRTLEGAIAFIDRHKEGKSRVVWTETK